MRLVLYLLMPSRGESFLTKKHLFSCSDSNTGRAAFDFLCIGPLDKIHNSDPGMLTNIANSGEIGPLIGLGAVARLGW
jgi:hypothetical protein